MKSCNLNRPWNGDSWMLTATGFTTFLQLESAGVPVEQWSDDLGFLAYERRTKWLFGDDLRDALRTWIEYSCNEGVGTVLDFSGKHASADVEYIYRDVRGAIKSGGILEFMECRYLANPSSNDSS